MNLQEGRVWHAQLCPGRFYMWTTALSSQAAQPGLSSVVTAAFGAGCSLTQLPAGAQRGRTHPLERGREAETTDTTCKVLHNLSMGFQESIFFIHIAVLLTSSLLNVMLRFYFLI